MSKTKTVVDLTCSKCSKRGEGTYDLPVRCYNCGFGRYSKTHETRADRCPQCGTKNLKSVVRP